MAEMGAQEIYDNFHDGVGGDGLASGAALLRKVAARYQERVELIRQLEAEMDAAWQGEAAGAAQRGAGPLLVEHEMASHHLSTAEDLTDRQSGSFFRAKNSVVPVPPMPTEIQPFVSLSTDWVPFKQQVTDHFQAAQHNVDVMNGYAGASTYNTENLPAAYGSLADDQAGIAIGGSDVIDVDDVRDVRGTVDSGEPASGDSAGPREVVAGPAFDGPNAIAGPGSVVLTPGDSVPPAGPLTSFGGSATSPGGYSPVVSGSLGVLGVDLGQVRPVANAGGVLPGVGIGLAGVDGFRAGVGGGTRGGVAGPGGGHASGPRGRVGGPGSGSGRGVIAGVETAGVRANSTTGGAGRGVGVGGVPIGQAREDEDRERKAPAYLEGDDPDELFGSDVLTAPAVIGEDDD